MLFGRGKMTILSRLTLDVFFHKSKVTLAWSISVTKKTHIHTYPIFYLFIPIDDYPLRHLTPVASPYQLSPGGNCQSFSEQLGVVSMRGSCEMRRGQIGSHNSSYYI